MSGPSAREVGARRPQRPAPDLGQYVAFMCCSGLNFKFGSLTTDITMFRRSPIVVGTDNNLALHNEYAQREAQ
jgi:hypothetical protein